MGPRQGDAISSLFGPVEGVPLEMLPFPAKVTGSTLGDGGLWRYSFFEQSWDPVTGAWLDAVPGRFGDIPSGIGLAFEANNLQAVRFPFFVKDMRPRGLVAGQMVCDFDAPPAALPPPEFPPTDGPPPPGSPPGIYIDVGILIGGSTVLWLVVGGVSIPICACPWFVPPSGSGSGSGTGGGGLVYTPCAPTVGVPGTLRAAVVGGPLAGTYALVYDPVLLIEPGAYEYHGWNHAAPIGECNAASQLGLGCSPLDGSWHLTGNGIGTFVLPASFNPAVPAWDFDVTGLDACLPGATRVIIAP